MIRNHVEVRNAARVEGFGLCILNFVVMLHAIKIYKLHFLGIALSIPMHHFAFLHSGEVHRAKIEPLTRKKKKKVYFLTGCANPL